VKFTNFLVFEVEVLVCPVQRVSRLRFAVALILTRAKQNGWGK